MSVLPDLVSPRPGVPKPPARDPGGRGLHAVPSRAPTRLCVSGSEVPPSQPSSSADEKAGLLCWGPGQEPRAGPQPACLPQVSPRLPCAPDLSGAWLRLLPGPWPQELRVGWTAVPWPRRPAGAQNLWTGPVQSHGLVFPGSPKGRLAAPSHPHLTLPSSASCPQCQPNSAVETAQLRAAWPRVSARLGRGQQRDPPLPANDTAGEHGGHTDPGRELPAEGPMSAGRFWEQESRSRKWGAEEGGGGQPAQGTAGGPGAPWGATSCRCGGLRLPLGGNRVDREWGAGQGRGGWPCWNHGP